MTTDPEVLAELKKINDQLKKLNKGSLDKFIGGFLYSFGYFAGTIAIFSIVAIYAARYNWPALIGRSVESMMSNINWQKIVPMPKIEIPSNELTQ